MEFSGFLQVISVIVESAVIVLAVRIAMIGKKMYGWLLAGTFSLYVIFDLSRLGFIPVPDTLSAPLFLIASLCALIAVFFILREVTGVTIRAIDREWL